MGPATGRPLVRRRAPPRVRDASAANAHNRRIGTLGLVVLSLVLPALSRASEAPAPCRYVYRGYLFTEEGLHPYASPLSPSDCAFVESLEEPLRRVALAGSLPAEAARISTGVIGSPALNALYVHDEGIILTEGFVSCLKDDPRAALPLLCHELGHAVQYNGGDPAARRMMDRLFSGDLNRGSPEGAAAVRGLENQADLIGRELCTRAGLPMDATLAEGAIRRCAPLAAARDGSEALSDHPSLDARMAAARADLPRLSDERAREIGAAIQRRARRLMAGVAAPEDDAVDLTLTPRQWALTPQADAYRLGRAPYKPSKGYEQFQPAGNN